MNKKIYFIRSNKTKFGGGENYLYRLSKALAKENIEHQIVNSIFPKFLPSWLRAILFNIQVRLTKRDKFYFSLDRITCPDLYRAGDGVHKVFLSIVYFIVLFPLESSATTWDRAYIESFAKAFLENKIPPPLNGKISISIASIDPRVIIKPCQVPLKANIPENIDRRNVNIKITCVDSNSWQIYLPAKIERAFAVVVATATIEKGVILSEQNIGIEYIAKHKIRGEKLTNIKAVLGSKAKKRIGKDRTITRKNVCLVCKGDTLTIIAKTESFMIKTQGTALSSGNLNQQIRVKNSRSGRVIKPKISAVNQVTINL